MPVTLLFGCCQVETCVSDLAAARQALHELVDARPVEQELARQIAGLMPGTGYDVDHLDCGGAVIQANRPDAGMEFAGQRSIHQAYLDAHGPCVTNLNYYVDDVAHARDLLEAMGAPVHIEGPSNVARALGDYGPDNTRPGGGERPFLFMGTRHLIGFDLEIMEPNFHHFTRQQAQMPAYVGREEADLVLHRLVVIVPDLDAAWKAIAAIVAPASRSKPYGAQTVAGARSFRVGLGGMEIEYRAPTGSAGDEADFLAHDGPGVSALVFGSAEPSARAAGDPRWRQAGEGRAIARVRDIVGFDIVLEPRERLLPG